MTCKAVIFDYVGTLVNCKAYNMDASKDKLYRMLVDEGFNCDREKFLLEYSLAHEKYRKSAMGNCEKSPTPYGLLNAFKTSGSR